MERRFKIVLSNPNIYKEIELSADAQEVKVGTDPECDVRLHKELFFEGIILTFRKDSQGVWSVFASDNLYVSSPAEQDASKPISRVLNHGDTLGIKYRRSDNTALAVEFLIDFDSGRQKFDRVIDISSAYSLTIGNDRSSAIVLIGDYVNYDQLVLTKRSDGYELTVQRSTYGVYHNGRKVADSVMIRDGDFFSLSDFFFYYKGGFLYTEIRDGIQVNGLSYSERPVDPQYPRFQRNTRLREKLSEEPIPFLDPPAKPQKPKNNLLTRLLPSMGMLVAAGIMAAFGGAMIILSAVSGAMAVITAVITYRQSLKEFEENSTTRISQYNNYVNQKYVEIRNARAEELAVRERIYISPEEEKQNIESFSANLFDRTRDDDDFLCVRLGLGSVEASRKIDYKKQERLELEDELQLVPEQAS